VRAFAESGVTVDGAAVTDGADTLFVADFSDTDTAWAAYQELKSLEDGATVAIDGVIVVKREADGALEVQKATDHSTRSGLKWGVVGGVVLGVIFPPSIIGSAAVLGAAGAVEGIATVLAIERSIIPPTINYETPDPECRLDYVPNVGRAQRIDLAISTSFGFGGHNACLAFSRLD